MRVDSVSVHLTNSLVHSSPHCVDVHDCSCVLLPYVQCMWYDVVFVCAEVISKLGEYLLLWSGFQRRWGWSVVYHTRANRTRQSLSRGLSLPSLLWCCLLLSLSVSDRVLGQGNQIL